MKCNISGKYLPSNRDIVKNINMTCSQLGYDKQVSALLSSLFTYMMSKNICGCCHAFSSVLFVAFTELGFHPSLFIGECQKDGQKPFDHSWITVDGKIIDIAVYYSLTEEINLVSGPIVFSIDVVSREEVKTHYGINTGLDMGNDTIQVMNIPFGDYMNYSPFEPDGLWGVLKKIYPMDIEITPELINKYHDVQRIFVR